MTEIEKIAFEKLVSEYGEMRSCIEEIISMATTAPERLKDRVDNYGVTAFSRQRKEIRRCIDALKSFNDAT